MVVVGMYMVEEDLQEGEGEKAEEEEEGFLKHSLRPWWGIILRDLFLLHMIISDLDSDL